MSVPDYLRTVILTVGLPRSGKTTWAQEHRDCAIVSPDAIRRALHGSAFSDAAEPMVWTMAKYFVAASFYAGHRNVIVDATNTTWKRRSFWQDDRWMLALKRFDADAAVCTQRAIAADRHDLVPVIARMADAFEDPADDPRHYTLLED